MQHGAIVLSPYMLPPAWGADKHHSGFVTRKLVAGMHKLDAMQVLALRNRTECMQDV